MPNTSHPNPQIQYVHNFQDLVTTPFHGSTNAICWTRELIGDFGEIVNQIKVQDNMVELHPDELHELVLSEQGRLARDILLHDMKLLEAHGASPSLNIINYYERDDSYPFFPTDVYSFHVDRAPIAADTILCTYYGECSEILPNAHGTQKILIPEIRDELKKIYDGAEDDFESFLSENFFDLHYQAKPDVQPIKLGVGHLCRLAIDHPESKVLPCLHRAPMEKNDQKRLLLIC
ncbi:MAG: hypothetical protein KA270_20040 [Saprospiraceae bacterium]|nr:hypothetical protein [Saprospiraceae bacterium]